MLDIDQKGVIGTPAHQADFIVHRALFHDSQRFVEGDAQRFIEGAGSVYADDFHHA